METIKIIGLDKTLLAVLFRPVPGTDPGTYFKLVNPLEEKKKLAADVSHIPKFTDELKKDAAKEEPKETAKKIPRLTDSNIQIYTWGEKIGYMAEKFDIKFGPRYFETRIPQESIFQRGNGLSSKFQKALYIKQDFRKDIDDLADLIISNNYSKIGIWCDYGVYYSVARAEILAKTLREKGKIVSTIHRDVELKAKALDIAEKERRRLEEIKVPDT